MMAEWKVAAFVPALERSSIPTARVWAAAFKSTYLFGHILQVHKRMYELNAASQRRAGRQTAK